MASAPCAYTRVGLHPSRSYYVRLANQKEALGTSSGNNYVRKARILRLPRPGRWLCFLASTFKTMSRVWIWYCAIAKSVCDRMDRAVWFLALYEAMMWAYWAPYRACHRLIEDVKKTYIKGPWWPKFEKQTSDTTTSNLIKQNQTWILFLSIPRCPFMRRPWKLSYGRADHSKW